MKNKVKDLWLGSNHNPVIFCLLEGISLKCKHIVDHLYWAKNPLAELGLTVDYKLNTNVYEEGVRQGVSVSASIISNLPCTEANNLSSLALSAAIRISYKSSLEHRRVNGLNFLLRSKAFTLALDSLMVSHLNSK